MNKLLGFVDTPQSPPKAAEATERAHHFSEIYAPLTLPETTTQASRCSQCGVPFCQVHCPLSNNIPDWLKYVAEGRMRDAYDASSATNTFPEICGRICPQDRLCEGSCVIEKDFGSVTIGAIERSITENAFLQGWVEPPRPSSENGLSVGIIGAGPAGLAAAESLRRKGYEVHIYDRYDRAGGLLIYGIPEFKLEKQVVERRRALFEQAGIIFHMNTDIGASLTLQDLRSQHHAVLIATGVYKARSAPLPNASLSGVIPALPYLTASNRVCLGDSIAAYTDGTLNASGKHVVVIGGGDTAMDCVRTAIRQGAAKVTCLYRRDRTNMPGSAREVKNAEEEGVEFLWLAAPTAFVGDSALEKILVSRMRLGSKDSSGRQSPVPIDGSDFALKADMAIMALGFDPEDLPTAFNAPELTLSRHGTLQVDDISQMTAIPGVFAAGDIVRGASLVVWAIKDGREAAEGMDHWLQAHSGQHANS